MKLTIVESCGKIVLCTAKGSRHAFTRELADEKYALDYMAATTGNMLVANSEPSRCFEIKDDVRLAFDAPCIISITGAPCKATLGGEPIPTYCVVQIKEKSEIRIEIINGGLAYLCVNGNADFTKCILQTGDSVEITDACAELERIDLRATNRPKKAGECVIRLLPLKGAASYSPHALELLYTSEFTVSAYSRATVEFDGVNVAENIKAEVLTYLPVGSLGFSKKGTPVILMNDSKSLGFDLPAACVITPDLPVLAQLSVGDKVRFSPCTVEVSQKLMSIRRREQKKTNAMLNPKRK